MKTDTHLLLLLAAAAICTYAVADDWPTYRHDNARSGVTEDTLAPPLKQCWAFQPSHPPHPSWPHPKRERPRVRFDDAFHVAIARDRVYFGSSADGKVYALDSATGQVRWQFITGGAVRLAPAVWRDRVLVGSDDGHVYCLSARSGELIWKHRAALEARQVIGHGRMISVQPPRAGVLVDNGNAYFACGIFPTEGVGLSAIDVQTGELIWRNDAFGQTYQRMAHGGTEGFSGVSPQGYMLASAKRLYVPCGRSVPAAFSREDGRQLFWHGATHHEGGTWALLVGDSLYSDAERLLPPNAAAAYYEGRKTPPIDGTRLLYDSPRLMARDGETGRDKFVAFPGDRLVVAERTSYVQNRGVITALDREGYAELGARENALARKLMSHFWKNYRRSLDCRVLRRRQQSLTKQGKDLGAADQEKLAKAQRDLEPGIAERNRLEAEMREVKKSIAALVKWRCDSGCAADLILAGNVLYAGGDGKVVAIDVVTGKVVWTGEIEGTARGLAVARGRLIVSSDNGSIYCFGKQAPAPPVVVRPPVSSDPFPKDGRAAFYADTASEIVRQSGVDRGFCLVYGCGEGRLMHELLKRTELQVYGYEPDRQKVAIARRALDRAGMLGVRANVFQAKLDKLPCSDYFANLVVSDTIAAESKAVGSVREAFRALRPCGGVALIGQPAKEGDVRKLRAWLEGVPDAKVVEMRGNWVKVVRGPLPGSGSWTHQYAEPGNSGSSMDALVRAPFSVLWFGRPGMARVVDRHARAASPLYVNGRLFHQGINHVWGIDAYNGRILWERAIRGAMRVRLSNTSSNMCATADWLFVGIGTKCLALDPDTGRTVSEYACPKAGRGDRWGWIATDGARLFGSAAMNDYEGDSLFSLDLATGRPVWTHRAGLVRNDTIAMAQGRVFLFESRPPANEVAQAGVASEREVPQDPRSPVRLPSQPYYPKGKTAQDIRAAIALDAETGKVVWRVPMDLTGMGKEPTLTCAQGVLLVSANMDACRLLALSAEDGRVLWDKKTVYFRRPVIVGETIYTLPYAHDLRTGRLITRTNPITGEQTPFVWTKAYGCGGASASKHAMFFRSGSLAHYDFTADVGVGNLGGLKPSCWISQIPAGGLWLAPEGSAGCTCAYPIRSTVALRPDPGKRDQWACYGAGIAVTPVKHLALNLGAPGDRRDRAGRVWFAWPRPKSFFGLKLDVKTVVVEGQGYFRHNPTSTPISNTDRPWVYSSGCVGLSRCVLHLLDKGHKPNTYTVRLHLAELTEARAGQRVFDIKLQGRTVADGLDVVSEAGGQRRALVKQFDGVRIERDLLVELVPSGTQKTVLCGIEAVRTGSVRGNSQ